MKINDNTERDFYDNSVGWEDDCADELTKKREYKKLEEENAEIRDSLDDYLPIDKAENERCWEIINELIDNEIGQEKFCNQ